MRFWVSTQRVENTLPKILIFIICDSKSFESTSRTISQIILLKIKKLNFLMANLSSCQYSSHSDFFEHSIRVCLHEKSQGELNKVKTPESYAENFK